MAHMITTKANGEAAYAYIDDMGAAWHNLGQPVTRAAVMADPDAIFAAAGYMERKIQIARVQYAPARGADPVVFDDRFVLIDSVSGLPMEVVSGQYVRHQPEQIAEFFREAFAAHGLVADSVGILRDGRSYFASATIGEAIRIVGSDTIRPNLLVRTSADGSGCTDLFNVVCRTVCANTEAVAMAESPNGLRLSYSHRAAFDPAKALADLDKAIAMVKAEAEAYRELSQSPLTASSAADVIAAVMAGRRVANSANGTSVATATDANGKPARTRRIRTSQQYQSIMRLYAGDGLGSTLPGVRGTAWGLFNAVTEYLTHHVTAKSDGHRFDANLTGRSADLRGTVKDLLLSYGRQDDDAVATVEAAAEVA